MNVYPVNLMENLKSFISYQIEDYSSVSNMWHPYLNYRSAFSSPEPSITASFREAEEFDTIIIGNTNAQKFRLELFNGAVTALDTGFRNIPEFLTIIKLDGGVAGNDLRIEFQGVENIVVGLFYLGEEWTLPRFVTGPTRNLDLRSESSRSSGGQAYGLRNEPLISFSCSFTRIPNEEAKLVQDYVRIVSTDTPHVIDPYPEAHENFAPFYATLTDSVEMTKREESSFYYNFGLSWQEAK